MFDHLLENIEKPGRYLGSEINARNKDFETAHARFVLAFPDSYEVGMSHLGVRLLYHLLNDLPGVMADRAYAPWLDLEASLREKGQPLWAVESGRPLGDFDIVEVIDSPTKTSAVAAAGRAARERFFPR